MTGILNALIAGVSGAVKDQYFNLVSLLLPGNGTNGAQNNTFLDGSSNNFTITRNGNTTQGTFSPFSQTGWGNYFNGSSAITMPSNSAFKPGSSDFTIECWYFGAAISGVNQNLWADTDSGGNNGIIVARITPTGNFAADYFTGSTTVANRITTGTINANAWNHLCISKTGTTLYVGINGVLETFVGPSSMQSPATIYPAIARLGNNNGGYVTGYISNFRYVVGSAIYTTNPYTVPKSQLTAISGTSLLTCQSNRFVDNSSNAFAITTVSSPSVVAFSPFAPTAAYTTAAVGGSGYFDGTGDELNVGSNAAFGFGTSAYTVELWVYLTAAVSATHAPCFVFNDATGGFGFYNENGGNQLQIATRAGSVVLASTTTLTANTWNHIVAVRSGTGTNQTAIFVNGNRVANGTDATNYTVTGPLKIGGLSLSNFYVNGYLSNVRIVKGSAVYDPTQSTITAPTAPLTAITNTSLLLNFTNAGITDATAKNDLETVGNAQISTSVSKFPGGGSIAFNASANTYLSQNPATTDLYAFGSGDFTIEFWLYLNSTTGIQTLYDGRPNGSANAAVPTIYITSGSIRYYVSAVDRITGSTLSTGQWYHIAIARSGGSTRMFINGTQAGSTYTDSTVYLNSANRPFIGGDSNSPNNNLLNGYIDDLRITKGYARYTSNFTAPTAPFPVQ